MRKLLLLLAATIGFLQAGAQQLYINEVSQGPSGSKEYVELLVAGTRTCTDSTLDIRGMIFDDNPGWYSSNAYNAGFFRFALTGNWAAVPYGSLIVVYNSADKNAALPTDDPYDLNHDYVYVIPDTSVVLQTHTAQGTFNANYSYAAATTWNNTGIWGSIMALGNPVDAFHIINPANPTTAIHSLGWGGTTGTQIYFSGSMAGLTAYNNGSQPLSQTSWTTGTATATTATAETPGAGNAAANTSWIAAMRVQATLTPGTPSAPSGPVTLCANGSGTYTVTPPSGAASYIWTLPSGWTGSSTSNTINVTANGNGGTISVVAVSACGQQSAPASLAVAIGSAPPAPGAISGNAPPCAGTTVTYQVSAVSNASSYTWTLPSGWTGSSTTNSITVVVGATGGTISVTANSAGCGNSAASSLLVNVLTPPVAPGAISGNAAPCTGVATPYSVAPGSGISSYNWTLPSGWTGSSATSSISGTPGAAGTITVAAVNACGPGPVSSFAVNPVSAPASLSSISGPASLCVNSGGSYTVPAVSGTNTYVWTLPNGWSGSSTTNTISVTAGTAGGTISVRAENGCGQSNTVTLPVSVNTAPAAPGTINGSLAPCANTAQTYSVTSVAGATYTWTLPSGWSGTSNTNSINVTTGTAGGTITVVASNGCGNSSASLLVVSVSTVPAQPGAITGSAGICSGVATNYSVPAVNGATYIWTLPSGWSGSSTTNTISATGTASGTISVSASNGCGSGPSVSLAVTVNTAPAQPAAISGPPTVCNGSANTYAVTPVTGVAYTWTLPNGWSGTSSTSSIQATAGSTGGVITVSATNSCGTATSPALAVTVTTQVTPSVSISANPGTTICQGTSVTFTATPANGGTPSYQWKRNNVVEGGNSATFTPATLNNGDVIQVVLTSSLGCVTGATATSNSLTMTVNAAPAQPAAITGSSTVCSNTANLPYSVPAATGVTGYTWTLPSGWSGTSTTNSITVAAGTSGGTISVTANNGCGPSTARTLTVTINSAPAAPAAISGPAAPCAGTPAAYGVAAVNGATSYTWTAPAGFTGGTNGVNSITYTAGSTAGAITVYASNVCGSSATVSLAVTPGITPATPGPISGATAVCPGTTQNYSVATVTGATSYTWTLPAGWSGGTSGSGISVVAGNNSGIISVVASSACGSSQASSLPVTVSNGSTTSVSIAANPGANVCAGMPVTFTAIPGTGVLNPVYTWLRNGQPVAQGPAYVSNSHSNGDVFSLSMTANSFCGGTATVASTNSITLSVTPSVTPGININTVPPTTLCQGSVVTFLTNIAAGGSFPQYQWYKNGVAIPGATAPTYASAGIASNDTLQVVLTSSATCAIPQSVPSNKVGLTVVAPVTPTVSVSASPGTTITPGTPVTFTANITGGGSNPGLQWYKNSVAIPGATGSIYTSSNLQAADAITVTLQSSAPCATQPLVTASPAVIRFASTGVGQTAAGAIQVQLFPNPNKGRFSVRVSGMQLQPGEALSLEVYNAVGQRLLQQTVRPVKAEWEQEVQLEGSLANGTYLLRLSSGKNRYAAPFIINQ